MNDKLSLHELQALYNELMPMFQFLVSESSSVSLVPATIADVVVEPDRATAQKKRNQQDEEDKRKIRGALSW